MSMVAPSFSRTIVLLAGTNGVTGGAGGLETPQLERQGVLRQAPSSVAVEGPAPVLSLVVPLVQSHPDGAGEMRSSNRHRD
jgi:hypothetical protein